MQPNVHGAANCAKFAQFCPISRLKQSHHLVIACAALTASVYSTWGFPPSARISVSHGCLLFTFGGLFFTSLFRCAHDALCRRRLVKAHHLTPADVLDIANKVVSSTQALFCCLTGYVILQHSCCVDVVHANHYVSHAYAWFGAAYFFYDIWSMYVVQTCTPNSHKQHRFLRYLRLNPIIVGHHLFIGIFGFAVIVHLRGNLGDCVFGFVYLMEASTPFVSIRSVLARFHLKHTRAYICNGFLMLVVFFVCRVAMFPYVVRLYAISAGVSFTHAVHMLPTGCKLSICVLMLPQIYWFVLMIKGATKIVVGRVATTVTSSTTPSGEGQ